MEVPTLDSSNFKRKSRATFNCYLYSFEISPLLNLGGSLYFLLAIRKGFCGRIKLAKIILVLEHMIRSFARLKRLESRSFARPFCFQIDRWSLFGRKSVPSLAFTTCHIDCYPMHLLCKSAGVLRDDRGCIIAAPFFLSQFNQLGHQHHQMLFIHNAYPLLPSKHDETVYRAPAAVGP